jgi:hypothetical protein
MSIIDELLTPFESIGLCEMDKVKLLNRIDTKFMFQASKLPQVLNFMKEKYRILEVEGKRKSCYETLYYDTPDHTMYIQHHNGKLNRFKVRSRKYIESNQSFFEIKFKNNKGRTIKKRIIVADTDNPINDNTELFLTQSTPFTAAMLNPALQVNYSRMTFVNLEKTERVTIDIDLGFSHLGKEHAYPGLIIAELKQSRSRNSVFRSVMHEEHIVDSAISKYCLGIITLNDRIKQNNFIPKLSLIKKLNHDIS